MFAADIDSERATSIEDYQNTCTEFINDICKDYKDWVDRYQLEKEETSLRKMDINNVAKITSEWILHYGNTIKKVDIIMNDGISKMAERTAGYPFKFEVIVNDMRQYILHPKNDIKLNVLALPREGRLVRIGNYQKDQLLLINSNNPVDFTVSMESLDGADILNDYIIIDSKNCQKSDLISITIIVEELVGERVTESRGYSTLLLIL
jgi:hypothetical protein